jgi:hypothetical protein
MAKREKDKDQIVEQEMKRLLSGNVVHPDTELLPPPGGAGAGPRQGKRGQGQPPPAQDTPAPLE